MISYRLYRRDPHQLFELLCLQLRRIATAYSEGLQHIIKASSAGCGMPSSSEASSAAPSSSSSSTSSRASTSSGTEKPVYDPVELLNCTQNTNTIMVACFNVDLGLQLFSTATTRFVTLRRRCRRCCLNWSVAIYITSR